ncbi:LLM class flavin-dependent oxidoreductase [Pigmentiphaga soli]|uniref:LLM class flavin-dependent oxidoreductase n=1 Tax=Pigmentiphaga soli TaxID=1007095 RepID=A0ABP8GEJ4_9BURK
MSSSPIGLCLRPEYDEHSLGRLADYARAAERRGFHSVWLAESWGMDATVLLSHLGAHTERIGLGTAIVNVFSRSPGLLAMAATSLNELYPGRFILGLGSSTKAVIEGFHGMPFDKPVTRMRETVQIVKEAMRGDEVHREGGVVSMRGYRLRVRPRQAPPPIYLAALSPASMKVVAETADGWLPYLLPVRGVAAQARALREAAQAAGRPADAVRIAPLVVTATSHDRGEARDVARRHLGFYLGAMGPHYRNFVAGFGFEAEVEAIREAWAAKERERAFAAVSDTMIDEMTLCGTPDDCRAQLARLREAGADLPILFFPGACTNAMVELAIDTLAEPAGGDAR